MPERIPNHIRYPPIARSLDIINPQLGKRLLQLLLVVLHIIHNLVHIPFVSTPLQTVRRLQSAHETLRIAMLEEVLAVHFAVALLHQTQNVIVLQHLDVQELLDLDADATRRMDDGQRRNGRRWTGCLDGRGIVAVEGQGFTDGALALDDRVDDGPVVVFV